MAILGHNGSGKSTLAKIMGALQNPLQGVCLIQGQDVNKISFKEIHSNIGMVFQNPDNQIVASIVEDDVAFAPENQGLSSNEIQKRVDASIQKVGLLNKSGALTSAMSGGEKQRMALAGAIAADVKCLILDEPTAMLDPEGRAQVEEIIKTLHKAGVTIVQITHQLEIFDGDKNFDVDRILVLSRGELIWDGTPEEFLPVAETLGFEKFERPIGIDELKTMYTLQSAYAASTQTVAASTQTVAASTQTVALKPLKGEPKTPQSPTVTAPLRGEPRKNFIEIKDLSFKFPNSEKNILDEVFLNINAGEWLSITGRTGSGKSTLVQHLNALYKIQAGEIFIDGEALPQSGEEVRALRQRVGLVFQNPEDQLFCPTVREELEFAPKNAGFDNKKINDAVLNAINLVGLDEKFLTRNPLALSGGERRLVAIASVLAAEPDCIILDEPLAGLDAYYKNKILNMLSHLRDNGKCVIVITHDINSALKFSDKIIIMEDGKCVTSLSLRDISSKALSVGFADISPVRGDFHSLSLRDASKHILKSDSGDEIKSRDKVKQDNNFSFSGFSILGQYVPAGSIIHKLDPRAKLISILFLVSSVFASGSAWALLLCCAVLFGIIKTARLSVKTVIKSSRPIFFLAAFTFIFNLIALFLENISPLEAVSQGAFLSSRLLILMFFAVLLPLTTTPLELSDGIGALLQPLERFKFPAQECAIMIGIALRFIPLLMDETDKITRAQLSRGAMLDQGGILKRLKAFFPVLIPLFIIIFKRADETALAMEARGYNIGQRRTRRKPLKWKSNDTLAVILCLIFAVIFFVL